MKRAGEEGDRQRSGSADLEMACGTACESDRSHRHGRPGDLPRSAAGLHSASDVRPILRRRIETPAGASIPRRTWLPSILTTVIVISDPIKICCDNFDSKPAFRPPS